MEAALSTKPHHFLLFHNESQTLFFLFIFAQGYEFSLHRQVSKIFGLFARTQEVMELAGLISYLCIFYQRNKRNLYCDVKKMPGAPEIVSTGIKLITILCKEDGKPAAQL